MQSIIGKTALLALVMAIGLAAFNCASAAAPAPGTETAGFEEFPLGDEHEVGPLHIAGVYFQPVDMEPVGAGGLAAADSDMHLEADISALEGNELGYGAGDFVPYLTVRYKAVKEGGKTIEGVFMPMSASDGPHYGNNVKLDGAILAPTSWVTMGGSGATSPDSCNLFIVHSMEFRGNSNLSTAGCALYGTATSTPRMPRLVE